MERSRFASPISASAESKISFGVKRVDEKVKEQLFVSFTVCLLAGVHILSKQPSQLIDFVKY